jgi:hypothetical protein
MRDLQAQSNGRTSHYNVLSDLYFPDGVYLVSDKLTFGKGRARSMHLRGESREGTIIKLKPKMQLVFRMRISRNLYLPFLMRRSDAPMMLSTMLLTT